MRRGRGIALVGLACAFLFLLGCDTAGDTEPTTTARQVIDTIASADEGCTFTKPWALDAWAGVDDRRGLVVHARVESLEPPAAITTRYGEYVAQQLNLENVEIIVAAPGAPIDALEMLVLVGPADPAGAPPLPLAAKDLAVGAEVVVNAYWDSDDPAIVKSAAVVDADGSLQFLGYCADGSAETLATMMAQLPSTDGRSEREVLVDWLLTEYG